MGRLQTCCGCGSLKTGTVFSGVAGILLSIVAIIVMFTTTVEFRTIIIDWLPSSIGWYFMGSMNECMFSVGMYVYLSCCLYLGMSGMCGFCVSVRRFVYSSVCASCIYMTVLCLYVYLYTCMYTLAVCVFICLFVWYACLSVYMFVWLYFRESSRNRVEIKRQ